MEFCVLNGHKIIKEKDVLSKDECVSTACVTSPEGIINKLIFEGQHKLSRFVIHSTMYEVIENIYI